MSRFVSCLFSVVCLVSLCAGYKISNEIEPGSGADLDTESLREIEKQLNALRKDVNELKHKVDRLERPEAQTGGHCLLHA